MSTNSNSHHAADSGFTVSDVTYVGSTVTRWMLARAFPRLESPDGVIVDAFDGRSIADRFVVRCLSYALAEMADRLGAMSAWHSATRTGPKAMWSDVGLDDGPVSFDTVDDASLIEFQLSEVCELANSHIAPKCSRKVAEVIQAALVDGPVLVHRIIVDSGVDAAAGVADALIVRHTIEGRRMIHHLIVDCCLSALLQMLDDEMGQEG